MVKEDRGERARTLGVLAFFAATGLTAAGVLVKIGLKPEPRPQAAPAAPPSPFPRGEPERPVLRRPSGGPSSLEFVGGMPAPEAPAASPPARQAASATTASAANPPAAPAGEGDALPADAAAGLRQAGVNADPAGLRQVGAVEGLLLKVAGKLLEHPRVLKALLDNRLVVEAFFGREDIRKACSSFASFREVLGQDAVARRLTGSPAVRGALERPDAILALAQSRMTARFKDCAAFQEMLRRPDALPEFVASQPAYLGIFTHPSFAQGLQAAGLGAAAGAQPQR